MNVLIIGPQGSGKGTQAKLLSKKFGLFYFEMGSFLREIAKSNKQVKDLLNRGVLVPDEEASSYVTAFLDEKSLYDNIIFDGFPRTTLQYSAIKKWFEDKSVKIDLVFLLVISEKESIKRLSARRMDPKTGEIYNLITNKPPDDIDISSLVQREDDKPGAIRKRLELYKNQTKFLIEEIKKDVEVVEIDGERPINTIQHELSSIIKRRKNGKDSN